MAVAGFDVGTNTTRFLVLDWREGRLVRLAEELDFTRTGEGLAKTGLIRDEAVQRTREAIRERLGAYGGPTPVAIYAFVTEAFRRAGNGNEALARLAEGFGFPFTLLAPEEEAEAGLLALQASFPDIPERFALVDVGGGSTEILRKSPAGTIPASMRIGSVVLTDDYLRETDPPAAEAIARLCANVREVLATRFPEGIVNPGLLFGVGGTATTAAQLALGDIAYDPALVHGAVLTRGDLQVLIERIGPLTLVERLAYRSLPPGRADVGLAGLVILVEVMDFVGVTTLKVSAEGILFGLLARELGFSV